MNTKSKICVAMAALALSGTMANAEALRASTAAPAGTPWVTHLEKSAANLAEASGGNLTMEVFPANQLGAELETIIQTARGRLDVGTFSITASATVVPEVNLLISPFFWDSFEQSDCAIDNHLTSVFNELFEARGLRIIQWQELGWQNFFSVDPITHPDQVKGLDMRIAPAPNNQIYWRKTGANGVVLPFAEAASAFQTGMVTTGELPTISYVASGLSRLAPNLTNTRHIYQPSIMLISLRTWNAMSAEEQEQFTASMESAQELRKQVRGAVAHFEGVLLEHGGTIHDLNDEERAAWAELWTDEMQQELIDEVGGEAQRVYDAVVAARAACTN